LFGKNPYDADFKVLNNLVNQVVPSMARGIFGEVGVLTDSDAARYKAMLPQAKDDPKVAKAIYDEIRDKVDSAYKITLGSYKKTKDVSGYEYSDVFTGAKELRGDVAQPPKTNSKIDLARQALNDPEATVKEKKMAREILNAAGVK
jgi:hypothetical protein